MVNMAKVGQLIKYISEQSPQNTPVKLSFFNFLKHFPQPEDLLDSSIVQQFFSYCLDYPHWQTNRGQLSKDTLQILEAFNHSKGTTEIDVETIRFPQEIQIVEIEQTEDFKEIIENYLDDNKGTGEKVRVFLDSGRRAISIHMNNSGEIKARLFDRRFTIQKGKLTPLRSDFSLYYTNELSLSPNHQQRFEIAPYITTQFKVIQNKVYGATMRGYVFQRHQEFRGEILQELTRLYIPLKRVEQFFIDRRTDNFYSDLVSKLEQDLHILDAGGVCEQAIGHAELAQTALEHVYLQDQLLSVLVRELKSRLKTQEECVEIRPMRSPTKLL